MRHHTGTHVVNGALRKLLGEHIWQAGSQLLPENARFDFAHYSSISNDQMKKIEELANDFVKKKLNVKKLVLIEILLKKYMVLDFIKVASPLEIVYVFLIYLV